MFLCITAEKGRAGKVEIIGYLLHGHVRKAETAFDGLSRIHGNILAGSMVGDFLELARQILGRDIQPLGKIVNPAGSAVTVFQELDEAFGQAPAALSWLRRSMLSDSSVRAPKSICAILPTPGDVHSRIRELRRRK